MRLDFPVFALAIALVACTESVVSEKVENIPQSTNGQPQSTALLKPEVKQPMVYGGQNSFSGSLFAAMNREYGHENILVSPFSVEQVLAQLYLGSRGNTEKEFKKILASADTKNDYIDRLSGQFKSLHHKKNSGTSYFRSLGRLWVQEGSPLEKPFLANIIKHFDSTVGTVDFAKADKRLEATRAINSWIKNQTNQKIDKILSDDSLSADTRLVLANASYFVGPWSKAFRAAQNRKKTFFNADQSKSALAMMNQSSRFRYSHEAGIQFIELEYKREKETDPSFVMEIYLADRSKPLSWLIQKMTEGASTSLRKKASPVLVSLTIPKWTASTPTYRLKKSLAAGGLVRAFMPFNATKANTTADFSGINGKRDLYLSDVLHKAFIKVDESGTEAAAATVGMVFGVTSVQPVEKSTAFVADHPFVYIVRDKVSGRELFSGQVAKL